VILNRKRSQGFSFQIYLTFLPLNTKYRFSCPLCAYDFFAVDSWTGCGSGSVHATMASQCPYTLTQSGLISFKEKGSKSAVTRQVPVSDCVHFISHHLVVIFALFHLFCDVFLMEHINNWLCCCVHRYSIISHSSRVSFFSVFLSLSGNAVILLHSNVFTCFTALL